MRVGIVHGDLNLENALVKFHHKSRNIDLIDFAIADPAIHALINNGCLIICNWTNW